jgi:predicted DNA-binding transcriptional regulator YafY
MLGSLPVKNLPKLQKAVALMTGEQGATIGELEKALNIKRRSVFRLITTIDKELKFPVKSKREGFGGTVRYHLPGKYLSRLNKMVVPRLSLSLNELLLLNFLLAHDTVFRGTEIYEDMQSLKKKLNTFLPKEESIENSSINIGDIFTMPLHPEKSYKGKEHIIDTLMEALVCHKSCNVTYHAFSRNTVKTYPIQPLKLLHHRGGLYVLAKIPKHGSISPLAVERIQAVELLAKTFTPPSDDELKSLLAFSFDLTFDDPVTAVIRFSPRVAPYICEYRWSSRQSLEKHEDGSCTLTISTSGRNDLLYWILDWGEDAEVLSPESFRQLVTDTIKKMAKIYQIN